MKGNMSKTIKELVGRIMPRKPAVTRAESKGLTAVWQNGLESGGHVQRKLRLGFANALTQRPAN